MRAESGIRFYPESKANAHVNLRAVDGERQRHVLAHPRPSARNKRDPIRDREDVGSEESGKVSRHGEGVDGARMTVLREGQERERWVTVSSRRERDRAFGLARLCLKTALLSKKRRENAGVPPRRAES
jgi:hypothetical protein